MHKQTLFAHLNVDASKNFLKNQFMIYHLDVVPFEKQFMIYHLDVVPFEKQF